MYARPYRDAVDLAQSADLAVLHHDGADVALDSVAENDVTMLLQLLQKQLTLARRDAVYVFMYVCIGMANQVSMVLKRKAQRNVNLYITLCMNVFIYFVCLYVYDY